MLNAGPISWARVSIVTMVLGLIFSMPGCQQYGDVSPAAYELATALYSIANRADANRLPQVKQLVVENHQSGKLSATEQAWLLEIVDVAEQGDWEVAMKSARTMLDEQVTR